MSIKLLETLNGAKSGRFGKYLSSLTATPNIAWYPSAGEDFRDVLFLNSQYYESKINQINRIKAPDIFIHTDYFPWENFAFLDTEIAYKDERTEITVSGIEELPRLDIPIDKEIVAFNASKITGRVFFIELNIECKSLGNFSSKVLYAFVENEAFCAKLILPNDGEISHVVSVRYGGNSGGGNASGIWLKNILHRINCKIFISDECHHWNPGDSAALKSYPELASIGEVAATESTIHSIRADSWSHRSSVKWKLIGKNKSYIEGAKI